MKGMRAGHGFKAHVGADAATAPVEEVSITSANINGGKAGIGALPGNHGEVFARQCVPQCPLLCCGPGKRRRLPDRRDRYVGTRRVGNTA